MALCNSFWRKAGTTKTGLLLERHTEDHGATWYILYRNEVTGSVDVAQRYGQDDIPTRGWQPGGRVRSTVMMKNIPGLDTTSPVAESGGGEDRWGGLIGEEGAILCVEYGGWMGGRERPSDTHPGGK